MFDLPRMLLISGTGRNSGKTSLACNLIEKWKNNYSLHALKITPHIHSMDKGGDILEENDRFLLMEEKIKEGSKDTMRYLKAGAVRSFLITAQDEYLGEALEKLFSFTGDQSWICESGGARTWIKPGVFLIVSADWDGAKKKAFEERLRLADLRMSMKNQVFEPDPECLELNEMGWKLVEKY